MTNPTKVSGSWSSLWRQRTKPGKDEKKGFEDFLVNNFEKHFHDIGYDQAALLAATNKQAQITDQQTPVLIGNTRNPYQALEAVHRQETPSSGLRK